MKMVNELSQLIFPQRCIGCSQLGFLICSSCRTSWHPHIYKTHIDNLEVTSSILYSPIAARIIVAAKENNEKNAQDLLIEALRNILNAYRGNIKTLTFVPIPSSKIAQRKRGRNFIKELCSQLELRYADILFHERRVRDQSGLSAKERSKNLIGAFGVEKLPRIFGEIVLIDDVVTTGATLREARRALLASGLRVSAAITACVAQPLR
jgi:ComF family protein